MPMPVNPSPGAQQYLTPSAQYTMYRTLPHSTHIDYNYTCTCTWLYGDVKK